MKKWSFALAFILHSYSALSFSAENPIPYREPLQRLEYERTHAKQICDKIRNDDQWRKIDNRLKERLSIFDNLPQKDQSLVLQSEYSIPKIYHDIKSKNLLPSQYSLELLAMRQPRIQERHILQNVRPAMVLRECSDLITTIAPINKRNKKYFEESLNKTLTQLADFENKYNEVFAGFTQNRRISLDEYEEIYINKSLAVQIDPSYTISFAFFPFHLLDEELTKEFKSKFDSTYFDTEINKNIESIKTALEGQIKRSIVVSNVKSGNLDSTTSCKEIGEALVSRDNIGSTMFGFTLSKDNQKIQTNPSGNIIASVGTVYNNNSKSITLIDSNSFTGEWYASVLRLNNKTKTFKPDFTKNRRVYFIGKYTQNKMVEFFSNNNSYQINGRAIEAICINGL